MSQQRHLHHAHHRASFSYPVSLVQKLYSIVIGPLFIAAIIAVLAYLLAGTTGVSRVVSVPEVALATAATLGRLTIAFVFALVVAVALALLATVGPVYEALLLPVFDILESIPILAFFPVIILLFIKFDYLNGAAIFIIFLSMLWNITFTAVGGLKLIPKDITYAAQIFDIRGWKYFKSIVLPAIFPQLVTGSILAFAQGWNLTIVAEALHVYMPGGTANQDLFGVGSMLVSTAASGQTVAFGAAVIAMVIAIALLNFFVWQKLLKYSQRFRFE